MKAELMQSQIDYDTVHVSWNKTLPSVILNEVKDQSEARNVYVYGYSRRVILHFVQDDKQTFTA